MQLASTHTHSFIHAHTQTPQRINGRAEYSATKFSKTDDIHDAGAKARATHKIVKAATLAKTNDRA